MASKESFFQKSIDELWFIKKCQNCTFKVNILCQKLREFFQKKNISEYQFRRPFFVKKHFSLTSIFEPLSFLKSCPIFDKLEALYSRNTMVSIEYIDFWPKSLSALKNFLCFYKGLAERNWTKPGESFSFVNYVNVNYFVKYSTVDCKYVLTSSTIFFL